MVDVDLWPGIASVLVSGLGQVLKGQMWRGLKVFGTQIGFGLLATIVSLTVPGDIGVVLSLVAGGLNTGFYLLQIGDAIEVIDLGDYVDYLQE